MERANLTISSHPSGTIKAGMYSANYLPVSRDKAPSSNVASLEKLQADCNALARL